MDDFTLASIAAKFSSVAAALIATGLSLHAAAGIVPLRPPWTIAVLAAAANFGITVALRVLASAAELAGDWAGASEMAGVIWLIQSASGLAALAAVAAMATGAILRIRWLLGLGGACAALSFGLTGHANGAPVPMLMGGIVALHVAIAGFWIAAPASLWPAQSMTAHDIAARHRRFGRIALVAVPVLFVAGITLALTFGGGVAALTASAYGGVIAAKAALASSALAVGAWNRLRLVEQLACDVPSARSNVRRAMALDAILFLAIAAATTAATTLFAPEVQ